MKLTLCLCYEWRIDRHQRPWCAAWIFWSLVIRPACGLYEGVLVCVCVCVCVYNACITTSRATRWRSWLRHCVTRRKVTGSIPDGVTAIFHWHNPSGSTMALGSTQPLTEMSTRNVSLGGKGARCLGLTTLPPSCVYFLEIWEPQPSGTLRACPGL